MKLSLIIPILLLAVLGCTHNPYKSTNRSYRQQAKTFGQVISASPTTMDIDSVPQPVYWAGTVNFNLRKPNFVIIHHTAQNSCPQTLHTFTVVPSQVSAHYVICKDGTVHHMLNDYLRAWQAGVSRWGNVTDINSISIGIELDNNGRDSFPPVQIEALLHLLTKLKARYNIPAANFIGHGDIAPGRKVDPSALFPWRQLADRGFGLWWGDTTGLAVPAGFDRLMALRLMGYDIRDSLAVTGAFKRHFEQDTTMFWGDEENKLLYSLYRKYQ